ncbi:MAG: hypothetical protein AAFY65_08895 [Pseudomonadota bacterium]
MRLAVQIDVFTGDFASQMLAYAHLLDTAERAGLSPDMDHIDVMVPPTRQRLGAYFDDATVAEILDRGAGQALVLVLPGALVTGRFAADHRLTHLGRMAGHMVRA